MSIRAMTHYWSDRPDITDKTTLLVLLALADWSDEHGRCFPSYDGIGRKCRISKRTAQRRVQELLETGELEVSKNGGVKTGSGSTNLYTLVSFARGDTLSPQEFARGDKMGARGDKMGSRGDIAVSPEPPIEPSDRTTTTNGGRPNTTTPDVEADEATTPDDVPCAAVFEMYQNDFGMLSQYLSEEIGADYDEYGGRWLIDAMGIALRQNVRKWSYVSGILKRWKIEGKNDGTVRADETSTVQNMNWG